MSDIGRYPDVTGSQRRFERPEQADAHVRAWRVENWFWNRFYADALDGAQPPKELAVVTGGINVTEKVAAFRARSPAALPVRFDSAPVLDAYEFAVGSNSALVAAGRVSRGHREHDPGRLVLTSDIVEIDGNTEHERPWWIRTRNTVYRLGGMKRVVPPLAWTAAASTFQSAVERLLDMTQQTVRKTKSAAVLCSREWTTPPAISLAKEHVRDLVAHLVDVGRYDLANAWSLLCADPNDRVSAQAAFLLLSSLDGQYAALQPVIEAWHVAATGNFLVWSGQEDDVIAGGHAVGAALRSDSKPPLLKQSEEMAAEKEAQDVAASGGPPRQFVVPAILKVALCKSWPAAWQVAREYLSAETQSDLKEAVEHANNGGFRLAKEIARRVYIALHKLSTSTTERDIVWMLALEHRDRRDIESLLQMFESMTHVREYYVADRRWKHMHDLVSFEHEPYSEDQFASAFNAHVEQEAQNLQNCVVPTELPKKVVAPAPDPSGVIVVEKLGGSRSSQSFKDANLAYGDLVGERLPLAPVPADLDSIRDALLAEYPYATAVIKTLLADLITAKHVRFKPTLLVSPPGLGKSRLCRSVSDLLRVPMARYDGASSLDNMFGGVTRSWHGSMPCFPFLALVAPHKRADGIVMIDEIDKASTRIQNGTLANALLPFLEGETAQRIADPYLLHPIDLSNVSYLLTANDELLVPPPLRDRLRVLRIPEPTADHLVPLARGIVRDVAKASGEDVRFFPDLDADEIDIAQSLWRGGSVRRLKRIVELILGHRERSARN